MITMTEIQNMTDEEVTAMNTKLTHKLVKRFALQVAVMFGVHIAIDLLIKKFDI
jgi:hypothetical protein